MNTITVKPYDHQEKAFNFAKNTLDDTGSTALLMDMGTGKTLTSIAVAGELYNQDKISKILVVCPTSVINARI